MAANGAENGEKVRMKGLIGQITHQEGDLTHTDEEKVCLITGTALMARSVTIANLATTGKPLTSEKGPAVTLQSSSSCWDVRMKASAVTSHEQTHSARHQGRCLWRASHPGHPPFVCLLAALTPKLCVLGMKERDKLNKAQQEGGATSQSSVREVKKKKKL